MPESYQPGQRRPIYGQNHRVSDDRYAWINLEGGKYLILVGEDSGHGPDVVLFSPAPGRNRNISISLTNLTFPELEAFAEFITTALAWARPVVERRDKEAQDAWDAGDDSHSRNYRGLPTVVYRKRPEREHSSWILGRPEDVSESSGDERGGEERRVRGAGAELAEPDESAGSSEDNSTTDD